MNQRVVLLGASNLTKGFPLVLKMLETGFPNPVEIHAAHGHGRSYGRWSRLLHRELPGIQDCNLWDNLKQQNDSDAPPVALITDVGNDLIYGAEVPQILAWVEQCLRHLTEHQSHIVLTLLPVASLEKLSPWRYHLTRAIFFPNHSSPWQKMLQQALELNEGLREMGNRYQAHIVEPPGSWYGFDPIHIRLQKKRHAWNEILSGWPPFTTPEQPLSPSLHHRYHALTLRPAQRRIWGRLQATPQPVLQKEHTILHLY